MRARTTLCTMLLLASSLFGQTLEVTPFEATVAKSVQVEQLTDSVAVIFTGREPATRTGAFLQVTSPAKWATPLLDGVNVTQTQRPGQWILFAKAGKYRILLAEFDPETGPRYTYHDLVIGQPTQPGPIDPPPPPSGDYSALIKAAKSVADEISDPKTRAALAVAYKSAIASSAGKGYEDTVTTVKSARRFALSARQGDSLAKDWNRWLVVVESELQKVAQPGDVSAYLAALAAIVESLES